MIDDDLKDNIINLHFIMFIYIYLSVPVYKKRLLGFRERHVKYFVSLSPKMSEFIIESRQVDTFLAFILLNSGFSWFTYYLCLHFLRYAGMLRIEYLKLSESS